MIAAHGNNGFSLAYMESFLRKALAAGYTFMTCREFMETPLCDLPGRVFIMKHDLDAKPQTLPPILDLELALDIRSTVYVRVSANDFNVMDYRVLPMRRYYEANGVEIGLHSNPLEYATINDLDPFDVIRAETQLLRNFLNVRGMSCHRDLNYCYNSLPWLRDNWERIRQECDLDYQAYDPKLEDNTLYVNEGYNPHLCWRNLTPEQAIETGQHIYMLTHNHWWWKDHPFELY